MKRKHTKKRWIIKCILFYLLGLAIGILLFWYYPSYKQAVSLRQRGRTLAESYAEEGKAAFLAHAGGTVRMAIYNTAQECIFYFIPDGEKDPDTLDGLEKTTLWKVSRYVDDTLKGKEVFGVSLNWDEDEEYRGPLVIVGVPVFREGRVDGALFIFRSYFTIYLTFLAFLVGYTILCIMLCMIAALQRNRKRQQEEMEALKRNYVDNVTHALKTPVCAIRVMAEALCDEVVPTPEKQKLYCGRILLEARKQERMIQDILKLSEIQNQRMDFSKSFVPAKQCFGDVLDNYSELCDCMDISFHRSEKLWQIPELYTNSSCIQEVLKALLDNAVKYVGEGGQIWADVSISREQAAVCIRDDGKGICREDQPRIFERFFKGSEAGNEKGSGLGLAIAKEIIDGLNEKIWVESEPGEGTSFYFTMHFR